MSKSSTALGGALEKLVATGHSVDLTLRPGHGQNKSEALVTDDTDAVVVKFVGSDFDMLAAKLVEATRSSGAVSPTTQALAVLDYLRSKPATVAAARFAALDAEGELVINPEFDSPVFHRQLAAAIRNGRAHGGAAVYDVDTGEVQRIEAIATKRSKGDAALIASRAKS